MKTCKTCKVEKPVDDFYRNSTYSDGRFSVCIGCVAKRVAARRFSSERQKILADEARRRRARSPEAKARDAMDAKARKHTEAGRAAERQRRSRDLNKMKIAARNAVNNAIVRGRMVRGPCEVCGKLPTHGHHDDYSKPLTVRWLCKKHHDQWHERYFAAGGEGGTVVTG